MANVVVNKVVEMPDISIDDITKGTQSKDLKITLDEEVVSVVSPAVNVATPMTGQITVTTGAQAVAGPDIALPNGAAIEALSTNGGTVFYTNVGNADKAVGDDITAVGYELAAGKFILVSVANLNQLLFGGSGDGYKFCWSKL